MREREWKKGLQFADASRRAHHQWHSVFSCTSATPIKKMTLSIISVTLQHTQTQTQKTVYIDKRHPTLSISISFMVVYVRMVRLLCACEPGAVFTKQRMHHSRLLFPTYSVRLIHKQTKLGNLYRAMVQASDINHFVMATCHTHRTQSCIFISR